MNFENLQKDLFERKFKLGEYFSKTFELLKIFLNYGLFCLQSEILGCFFPIY